MNFLMARRIAVMLSILLLFSMPPATKSDTIIVREGESIQDAINNAMPGDTIIIEGTFHESVIVNKSIVIEGRNATIYGENASVFNITAHDVILRNISIFNSTAKNALIYISGGAIIENCIMARGRYGVFADGIAFIVNCNISRAGSGCVIKNNSRIISSNFFRCGIGIECYGNGNIISNGTAHYCGVALYMENSSYNVVEGCNFYKNNNNECAIFMLRCKNNTIRNCDISYIGYGIRIMESGSIVIEDSKLHHMRYGVEYEKCNGCRIYGCDIYKNRFGVEMRECKNMQIIYNDFENKMYNLHAIFSYCNARHNYWGTFYPAKIKNDGSIIIKIPWLIKPLHDFEYISMEEGERQCKHMSERHHLFFEASSADFDPMVDIKTIFTILRIRSFDMSEYEVTISIDGKENSTHFKGDVSSGWKAIQDVDDGKQMVEVDIKVGKEKRVVYYDLATGNWYGDDWLGDGNGYGHILMDGYEIWFDISYNDYDGDGLTYWEEKNIYHTDPEKNNAYDDPDKDGIPFFWEDKYGFNPLAWDNHSIDYDGDGLNNFMEYMMQSNLSNPFGKDIFLEIDYMPGYKISNESVEMLYNAFALHNITIHIFVDDEIPLKERLYYNDLKNIYWEYFLDGDMNSIKHGVFHYEVIGKYSSFPRGGHAFVGWDNLDSFMLGGEYINKWRKGYARKVAYASLTMHELGHTLGLFEYNFGGIDNESCNAPWMRGFWVYRNYRSCLNYRYAFQIVDYSDGKHGRNDFDDWSHIDLNFFRSSYFYP